MQKKIKKNIKVGRYLGIDVYLHYSWFFIFALLAWGLATGFFPERFPDHASIEYWILGLISSALLFVSVLMHELAHSFVATHQGMKVERITLFFFGGMAGIQDKKMSPGNEFRMAIAGPALSLVLAGITLAIYNISPFFHISAIAAYLYRINFIVAVFNIVPAFPLDGGRVLRSIVWYWSKDFNKATKIATTGGRIFSYFLIFTGIFSMFSASGGGLWFVLIGLFILFLANSSYDQLLLKEILARHKAKDFLVKTFASVDENISVEDAVVTVLLKRGLDECIVLNTAGQFKGMITQEDIMKIPKDRWGSVSVGNIIRKAGSSFAVKISLPAYSSLVKMLKAGLLSLPVKDNDGKLVGIIRRDDILRFVRLTKTEKRFRKAGFDTS